MDLELTDKVALVTGASRGIGRAIARALAEEGVDVAIAARGREALDAAAAEIAGATGRRILPIAADVRDAEHVRRMVDGAAEGLGGLDILVSNAGVAGGMAFGPIEEVDELRVQADLETKFLAVLRCARAAAPLMKRRGFGRIIAIGGLSSRYASRYRTTRNPRGGYNYSGGPRNIAVTHLIRTLAHELGVHGITANVVLPGATATEDVEQLFAEAAAREGVPVETVRARAAEGAAIGRVVAPREVAAVVAFLASPRAAAVSGEAVAASGGAGLGIFL